MNSIAVVIVTFNRVDLLKECIASVRTQSFTDFQIIVINNGSTDNTKDWLKKQNDIISIHQENLGGAGGFFTGIKYASERGFEYCWIMDDDVICKEDSLRELYDAYSKKNNIGFVCSRVLGTNGKEMNVPIPDMRQNGNAYWTTFDMLNYKMAKVIEATFVSLFFSTRIVFEIGLPYREFFIWGDDSEYTRRISNKYASYIVGSSTVFHKRAQQEVLSFETEMDPQRLNNFFYFFRNNFFNEYKKRGAFRKISFLLFGLKDVTHLLITGNVLKSRILAKAYIALPRFKPKIEFPQNKYEL